LAPRTAKPNLLAVVNDVSFLRRDDTKDNEVIARSATLLPAVILIFAPAASGAHFVSMGEPSQRTPLLSQGARLDDQR
jgi:hypothetical protein